MEQALNVNLRDKTKEKNRRLINEGIIPAAIYGYKGNFNIKVNDKEFVSLYKQSGTTSLIKLSLDGKVHNVYIQEAQFDPVYRNYTHISFREVNLNEEIISTVPFVIENAEASPAVKEQNHLVILAISEIDLRGLPSNLPQEIKLDASKFNAGDSIHMNEIELPEGVALVHEEDANQTVMITTDATIKEEEPETEEITEEGVEGEGNEGEDKKEGTSEEKGGESEGEKK